MLKSALHLDSPEVKEHLHLFDVTSDRSLCAIDKIFLMHTCIDCPFGRSSSDCLLSYKQNPQLPLFVEQLRSAHPELFI